MFEGFASAGFKTGDNQLSVLNMNSVDVPFELQHRTKHVVASFALEALLLGGGCMKTGHMISKTFACATLIVAHGTGVMASFFMDDTDVSR